MKNKKNKLKTVIMAALMFLMVLTMPVYATSGALTGLTNLANLFSSIVRLAGVIILIYGFSVFGPGFSQHDATGIRTGLLIIAGGVIMVFHMEILGVMGVTI